MVSKAPNCIIGTHQHVAYIVERQADRIVKLEGLCMMDCGVAIDGENGVAGLLATDDVQPACMESDPRTGILDLVDSTLEVATLGEHQHLPCACADDIELAALSESETIWHPQVPTLSSNAEHLTTLSIVGEHLVEHVAGHKEVTIRAEQDVLWLTFRLEAGKNSDELPVGCIEFQDLVCATAGDIDIAIRTILHTLRHAQASLLGSDECLQVGAMVYIEHVHCIVLFVCHQQARDEEELCGAAEFSTTRDVHLHFATSLVDAQLECRR